MAKAALRLEKAPSYRTVYRMLKQETLIMEKANSTHGDKKKSVTVANKPIEQQMDQWVKTMWSKSVYLTEQLIQAKARRLFNTMTITSNTANFTGLSSVMVGYIVSRKETHSSLINHNGESGGC